MLLAGDVRCQETATAVRRLVVSGADAIRAGIVTAVTRMSVDKSCQQQVRGCLSCHTTDWYWIASLHVVSLSTPTQ